jgi:hypothetical protein
VGDVDHMAGKRVNWSVEQQFLLCCARARMDQATVTRVRALAEGGLDWEYIRRVASRHEIVPLVQRHIRAICPSAAPREIADDMLEHARRNALQNLSWSAELIGVLGALKDRGIASVAFKGPVLAAALYGDVSVRQFCDLDILVRPDDLAGAVATLAARGYRQRFKLSGALRTAYLQSECAYDLVNDDGVAVEVHWGLSPQYFPTPVDLDGLWKHTELVPLAGQLVPTLGAGDLLLFLCMHGSKHRWEGLKWIADVAELIDAHPELDWFGLLDVAYKHGCRRMVCLGLALASDVLGAQLAPAVRHRIWAEPSVQELAEHVRSRLFSEAEEPPLYRNRFHLRSFQSLMACVRYILYVVLVPTKREITTSRLRGPLTVTAYPLHLLRLLGSAVGVGRALCQMWRSSNVRNPG